MSKEERKAYMKAYYQKNKVEALAYDKAYKEKHKKERAAYGKAYKEEHKENIAAYGKAWRQSSEGKKLTRISKWKRRGIISADWNSLYERYLDCKNCEKCNVVLTVDRQNTSTTRCLDHDHSILDRENVRNILCVACNTRRG